MLNTISDLFNQAKAKDEFNFICTLINYKGMGSKYFTSNLLEWFQAIDYYETLYSEENNLQNKVRIGLLIYSTFFESTDLYNIVGNLCRNILGFKGSSYLYWKHKNADRWLGTAEKVSLINGILVDVKADKISTFFIDNHIKQLRNSFFHSSYAIEDDMYYLKDSDTVFIDGIGKSEFSISEFILPKVDNVIDFFKSFKDAYKFHYESYTADKIIEGFFPDKTNITVLGSHYGLRGFVADGSYIKLDDDFWTAMNIRFDKPSEERRFIIDEIKRLIDKHSIKTNDGSLQYLYEVVTERNVEDEMTSLSIVFRRFGDMKYNEADAETNHFKQIDLQKRALSFYQKMLNLDYKQEVTNNITILKFNIGVSENNINLVKESVEDFFICINHDKKENPIKNSLYAIEYLKSEGENIDTLKKRFLDILKDINDPGVDILINETCKSLEEL